MDMLYIWLYNLSVLTTGAAAGFAMYKAADCPSPPLHWSWGVFGVLMLTTLATLARL